MVLRFLEPSREKCLMEKILFLTSLKQICNEYLIKLHLSWRKGKTSPCSPCVPNLLHVLPSWMVGWHKLCSPAYWGNGIILSEERPSKCALCRSYHRCAAQSSQLDREYHLRYEIEKGAESGLVCLSFSSSFFWFQCKSVLAEAAFVSIYLRFTFNHYQTVHCSGSPS